MALLAVAGLAAGAVNAVAGGGSLISFPALLAAGYPSVPANMTNAVAVLPGYVGGSLAYRSELEGQRRRAVVLGVTSVAGAIAGAWLLTATPQRLFERIVPFLILLSCALLAAQPAISRRLPPGRGRRAHRSIPLHAGQLVTSIYGGYFGGGLGILLLAVLGLGLRDDLHRLNALKGLLSLVIGATSAVYFALFGPVAWGAAAIMVITSLLGGQVGVAAVRRLSPALLRWLVVVLGVAVAILLFLRG
ncbi:MAG: sulfite exporter TauE/SafE family protein [Solirubrobacteraceae bacterium]